MTTEERAQALLALVAQHRTAKCAELIASAEADARAGVREAFRRARARMRETIVEERRRYGAAAAAAEAQLHTRRRLARQGRESELLAAAWQQLPAALRSRWLDPDRRRQWMERHLAAALATLPHEPWQVLHAPGPGRAERTRLVHWLAARGGPPASFVEDAALAAGLRVHAGHNMLDATLDGLLADRTAIEGRLLHHLEEDRT